MSQYTLNDLEDLEALEGADEETIREFEMEQFAESGILPQRVSETGDPEEPLSEVIICSAISGGADYVASMPRTVTLQRRGANGIIVTGSYVLMFDDPEEFPEVVPVPDMSTG